MSKTTRKTASKQARKPQRFARLCREADTGAESLVIRQVSPSGKETTDVYTISEIGTDEATARAFRLTKSDNTSYNCEVSRSGHTCDCKGHLQHSHCKHCESLAVLLERGYFGGFPEPRVEVNDDYPTDEEADAQAAEYYDSVLDAA